MRSQDIKKIIEFVELSQARTNLTNSERAKWTSLYPYLLTLFDYEIKRNKLNADYYRAKQIED